MEKAIKSGKNGCLFLTDSKEIYYFTGGFFDDAYFVKGFEQTLFLDARYYAETAAVKKGVRVKKIGSFSDVKDYLNENGLKELYLDYEKLNVKDYFKYVEEGFTLKDCSEYLKTLFRVKKKSEINLIKKASSITEKAFYKSIKKIKKGITERALKTVIENNIKRLGKGSQPAKPRGSAVLFIT